jgi:1-aminocyclopropane-1-carboxylate deaminase/D-cysteine desulfhydrase-like pyridoxal-dependent ACC family enzyme
VCDAVYPPGYGRLNDAVREAMAMAGLSAYVRCGRIAARSRVLFIHTGGLPALFAYTDKLGTWLSKAPWAPAD